MFGICSVRYLSAIICMQLQIYNGRYTSICSKVKHVGYEPAGLTLHPLPQNCKKYCFFVYVSSVTKNVFKEKPENFGVIQVKRPKDVDLGLFTQI